MLTIAMAGASSYLRRAEYPQAATEMHDGVTSFVVDLRSDVSSIQNP